eukprot:34738-Prorocentrum_minimum.AAC.1
MDFIGMSRTGKHSPSKAWNLHFQPKKPPTYPLRPVIPNNAYSPRITAAAGTEVSRSFFFKSCHCLILMKEVYNTTGLHPSRGITGSGFRPVSKIPHCCF